MWQRLANEIRKLGELQIGTKVPRMTKPQFVVEVSIGTATVATGGHVVGDVTAARPATSLATGDAEG